MANTKLAWLGVAAYAATALAASIAPYQGYSYVGCFTDSSASRTLINKPPTPAGVQLTIEVCIDTCKAENYDYAGMQYYSEVRSLKVCSRRVLIFS